MSDIDQFFNEIKNKQLEDEKKAQLERDALRAQERAEQIAREKTLIENSIKEHLTSFKNKKYPLLLTNFYAQETIDWVMSFGKSTLDFVEVYRYCPKCHVSVLISKNGQIKDDHPCDKMSFLYCHHGNVHGSFCGDCYHETSGN